MPYRTIGQGVPVAIVFLHQDHLGSLRYASDMNGSQRELHKYLPYGEEAQVMASVSPFRYAGYEFDDESKMHYVGARYFTQNAARWLTPDPVGDGYRYSGNSPITFYDPTGLEMECTQPPGEPMRCTDKIIVPGNPPPPTRYANGSFFPPPTPPPVAHPSIQPSIGVPPREPERQPCKYAEAQVTTGIPGVPFWGGMSLAVQKNLKDGDTYLSLGIGAGGDLGSNFLGALVYLTASGPHQSAGRGFYLSAYWNASFTSHIYGFGGASYVGASGFRQRGPVSSYVGAGVGIEFVLPLPSAVIPFPIRKDPNCY
jgi:RHS repeat-associated protein